MKLLMDQIYNWNPFLVWNFGASVSYAGVMRKFTTYVHMELSNEYPAVEADMIVNYWEANESFQKNVEKYIDSEYVGYVGYQEAMINYMELMDVFLNPPRLGGGAGAFMAMSLGKPVITLEEGDVGIAAGEEFTAKSMEDFLPLVKNYCTDREFYLKQSERAIQRYKDKTTSEEKFADMIQQVFDLVEQQSQIRDKK
jgi:glycosyltransferase involved in cell wall biosynthesis